jgi:uroporphyrinogen decarboxylase
MNRTIKPINPDWEGLLMNLKREGTPERVCYFEHGIADNILAGLAAQFDLWPDLSPTAPEDDLRRRLAVHRYLGHELFRVFPPGGRIVAPKREGAWAEEGRGPVATWEEYETYPWPEPKDADLSVMEELENLRPDNMRAFHVLDVWEVVRELMGFEHLCFALYETPALVEAVFAEVGGFAESVCNALCDFETFGALYLADDLGYKAGLMISPNHVRSIVLPWHKRLATLTHDKGKLLLFHCCGDMYSLIDDYIDDVQIDAKHSFEDNVLPVTEAKRRYGDRLSLLGGMDVDLLARSDEATIRSRTREILEVCHPGGGYCFGSGNWVTEYIPLHSYVAMLDEAQRFLS